MTYITQRTSFNCAVLRKIHELWYVISRLGHLNYMGTKVWLMLMVEVPLLVSELLDYHFMSSTIILNMEVHSGLLHNDMLIIRLCNSYYSLDI